MCIGVLRDVNNTCEGRSRRDGENQCGCDSEFGLAGHVNFVMIAYILACGCDDNHHSRGGCGGESSPSSCQFVLLLSNTEDRGKIRIAGWLYSALA
jgi:hypothetical protein